MRSSDPRATEFVAARRSATGLSTYPGDIPQTLEEAYRVQDAAIDTWGEVPVGWKVGGIAADWVSRLGVDRLSGPIFPRKVFSYTGEMIDMPVFAEGFAAVEGEITAVLGADAPGDKFEYTSEDALRLIDAMHVGVEIASSPFSEINEHGPLVTISDFGNNCGLILGAEIADWREFALDRWEFETLINGQRVGKATPSMLNGGPLESVRFLLENVARRGRPAKAGMKILTGAVTGVHQAFAGDEAEVTFALGAPIRMRLVPASASTAVV